MCPDVVRNEAQLDPALLREITDGCSPIRFRNFSGTDSNIEGAPGHSSAFTVLTCRKDAICCIIRG